MSKRGPRFSEKEKLAIFKEGKKNGVKAACAKYDISDQAYRVWRYKAAGIQPRKQFSIEKKSQILEEGFQEVIEQVCAAYRINLRTYYRWKRKLGFTQSLRRSFTKNEQLLIVKDAIRDGISKASRKHKVNGAKVHGWAQQLGLQIPKAAGRFTVQEKLRILEEGYQNGISRVCNAYQIDPTTYYYWKRVLGYSKHLSFTEGERRVIVSEAIRDGYPADELHG